jgi:hypothetical protein
MPVFNITLPPMPRSSNFSLSPQVSHQNSVCTSSVSHMCQCSWFDHPQNVGWEVETIKLLVPSPSETFRNTVNFCGDELLAPGPTPKLENTPCRLSATAYSIHSQYPLYLEAGSYPQSKDTPSCDDGDPRYPRTNPKLYSEIYLISTDQ